jgi:hypothetical protein
MVPACRDPEKGLSRNLDRPGGTLVQMQLIVYLVSLVCLVCLGWGDVHKIIRFFCLAFSSFQSVSSVCESIDQIQVVQCQLIDFEFLKFVGHVRTNAGGP